MKTPHEAQAVENPKPPTSEAAASAAITAANSTQQRFRDAFTTRCNGCSSMLMLQHPYVHCPNCHHVWKARRLTQPVRCVACDFNLFNWRKINSIPDRTNAPNILAS